jgi:hypothetical protein
MMIYTSMSDVGTGTDNVDVVNWMSEGGMVVSVMSFGSLVLVFVKKKTKRLHLSFIVNHRKRLTINEI